MAMKQRAVLLGVLALVAIGLMVGMIRYAGLPIDLGVYANASFTSRVFDLALTGLLGVVLMVGLVRLAGRQGAAPSPVLDLMSWVAPMLGLLAGAREGSIIWVTVAMTHVTLFKVIAPSIAEALVMPALGLLAGAAAAAFASRAAGA